MQTAYSHYTVDQRAPRSNGKQCWWVSITQQNCPLCVRRTVKKATVRILDVLGRSSDGKRSKKSGLCRRQASIFRPSGTLSGTLKCRLRTREKQLVEFSTLNERQCALPAWTSQEMQSNPRVTEVGSPVQDALAQYWVAVPKATTLSCATVWPLSVNVPTIWEAPRTPLRWVACIKSSIARHTWMDMQRWWWPVYGSAPTAQQLLLQ